MPKQESSQSPWRSKLYEIIFEAETTNGKLFDVLLIFAIILSVLTVCLESIENLKVQFGTAFLYIEWIFTIGFTIEYILRLLSVQRPLSYALSFYGIIDLLAILPSYIAPFYSGAQSLHVIRSIRLIRIFRLFKLTRYVGEGEVLKRALRASRHKIIIFLFTVLSIALFSGALLYLVEGSEHGFTSIPKGMYWAIVTMTTVGYGDLAPQTDLGRTLASFIMIMGYGIIAVPTGIVTAEITHANRGTNTRTCSKCMKEGHEYDATYCRTCGEILAP